MNETDFHIQQWWTGKCEKYDFELIINRLVEKSSEKVDKCPTFDQTRSLIRKVIQVNIDESTLKKLKQNKNRNK